MITNKSLNLGRGYDLDSAVYLQISSTVTRKHSRNYSKEASHDSFSLSLCLSLSIFPERLIMQPLNQSSKTGAGTEIKKPIMPAPKRETGHVRHSWLEQILQQQPCNTFWRGTQGEKVMNVQDSIFHGCLQLLDSYS